MGGHVTGEYGIERALEVARMRVGCALGIVGALGVLAGIGIMVFADTRQGTYTTIAACVFALCGLHVNAGIKGFGAIVAIDLVALFLSAFVLQALFGWWAYLTMPAALLTGLLLFRFCFGSSR